MEGWNTINSELPPLDLMIEVKCVSRTGDVSYWETYLQTPLIRHHVIIKWRITHWKLKENQNEPRGHNNITGKYQ